MSVALYDELVQPLLHVLPMAPGYDVSAAAALSCFHVFALQAARPAGHLSLLAAGCILRSRSTANHTSRVQRDRFAQARN